MSPLIVQPTMPQGLHHGRDQLRVNWRSVGSDLSCDAAPA